MSTLLEFLLTRCDQFKRGRLPSLYSDFTLQRFSNPDGFVANIEAWQQALVMAARSAMLPAQGGSSADCLSFVTGDTLLQALETKEWGRPLALGTVIDESMLRRQIMPFQDFIKEAKDIRSWDWKIQPWWLLSWAFKQMGILGSSKSAHTLPLGHFVIIANVESACGKVLGHVSADPNEVNRIYPMNAFRKMAGIAMGLNHPISEDDLTILLTSLARDKDAIVYDQEVVKFKATGDVSKRLSMEDKTIASLKVLIADLSGQIDQLSDKIESLTTKAQEAAKKKDRVSALSALKSRKLKESALVQRMGTLSQVEEVLQGIEQAQDHVAMVKVMKASTSVLQNLRQQAGGIDEVETVVENLRDEMQQVNEVGEILESGAQRNTVDEDAIDAELEQIMGEAKAKEDEQEAKATQQRLAEIEHGNLELDKSGQPDEKSIEIETDNLRRLSIKEQPAGISHLEAAPVP